MKPGKLILVMVLFICFITAIKANPFKNEIYNNDTLTSFSITLIYDNYAFIEDFSRNNRSDHNLT